MNKNDIDIKQDGDKVVFDFTNETSRLMRGFHANLERLCKEDFDRFAAANGYIRLEPGQCVVKADDVKELLHLWISHGPRFAEINRVMRAFAGTVALVECLICRGSGTIRIPHPMKPFALDYIDHCHNCKGTGFVSAALDASGVK